MIYVVCGAGMSQSRSQWVAYIPYPGRGCRSVKARARARTAQLFELVFFWKGIRRYVCVAGRSIGVGTGTIQ